MTLTEIVAMLESFGIPYAYYTFPVDQAPPLPYCVYYFPNNNDVMADNRNYVRVVNIVIELYTENKDFALEDNIESKLLYPYTKEVVYINSERMYQITYESEVVLKNE